MAGLCFRGCCCTNKVGVLVKGCTGTIGSASATFKDSGGATLGTCTTASDGTCMVDVGNYTGTVNITVTIPTGPTLTQSTTIPNDGVCHTLTVEFDFIDRICFTGSGCDGALSGVAVTLSGYITGGCTTDGTGACCFTPTSYGAGPLTVTATYNGRAQTVTVTTPTIGNACSFAFGYVTRLCCCVNNGCSGEPFSFAITVTVTVNGTSAGSGTTDSNGRVCITPTYGTLPGDTVVFTATAPTGFLDASLTVTLATSLGPGCGASGAITACLNQWTVDNGLQPCNSAGDCHSVTSWGTITLPINSASFCCNTQGCPDYPNPLTLTVNDGLGDISVTTTGDACHWTGCATRSASEVENSTCTGFGPGSVLIFVQFDGANVGISVCEFSSLFPQDGATCTPGTGIGTGLHCPSCGGSLQDTAAIPMTFSSCNPIDGSGTITTPDVVFQRIYGTSMTATVTH